MKTSWANFKVKMLEDLHQFKIPSQLFSTLQLSRLTKNDLHSLGDDKLSEVGKNLQQGNVNDLDCMHKSRIRVWTFLSFSLGLFVQTAGNFKQNFHRHRATHCGVINLMRAFAASPEKCFWGEGKAFVSIYRTHSDLTGGLGVKKPRLQKWCEWTTEEEEKKTWHMMKKVEWTKKQYFLLSSGAIYSPLQNEHKLQLWKFHWTSSSLTYHVVRAAAAAIDWKCNAYTWEFFWWMSKRRTAM